MASPTPEELKNPARERSLFSTRAWVAAGFVLVLLGILAGRAAYLQIHKYQHFATRSQDNRVRVVAVPPPRGLIYDRNGLPLAVNLPSYRLEVTPSEVGRRLDAAGWDALLDRIGRWIEITEADRRRFHAERGRKRPFQPITLRFNLSDEEVARFAVHQYAFPGVQVVARPGRYYPRGGAAVHSVGYVGRISEKELKSLEDPENYSGSSHIGKTGVERHYESWLHGRVGLQHVEINAQGRALRILDEEPPEPGVDLLLSLDMGLQAVAEQALGDHTGAVVAIDPHTGDVLALVSKPTYDPNPFVNGIGAKAYRALLTDPDRPLFNRALTGRYPPGSTIKPFMGLAGLELGVTTPEKTLWAGPYYKLPNSERKYRDWKRGGHGRVNLHKSIVQSCDVYFYDLAYRMGIDRIHGFLSRFGFGQRLGIDATGESPGLLPSRTWKKGRHGVAWFPGDTVNVGIGQGFLLATPLQLASATATIAMRGKRFRPRLVRAVRRPGASRFEPLPPQALPPVVLRNPAWWDVVIEAMKDVTRKRNGTAWRIGRDAPYAIAAKTGTAQVFGLKEGQKYDAKKLHRKLHDHALFIAFAPADDPQIAVAVVVEHGGHGGSAAGPVARAVMDYHILGRAPEPRAPEEGDGRSLVVRR